MKFFALTLVVVFSILSCEKTDVRRDVETYSSIFFTKFEEGIDGRNILFAADESLILTGNVREEGNINRTPVILKINQEMNISWLTLLPSEPRYTFSEISLNNSSDDEYLFLLNSRTNTQEENDIDISKVDQFGDIVWNRKLSDDGKNLISSSMVKLSTGEYIVFSEDQQNIGTSNQLHLSKISASGNLIWSKLIDDSKVSISRGLFYFPADQTMIGLSEDISNVFNGNINIHKFDIEGNVIWQKALTESSTIWPGTACMTVIEDSHLMAMFTRNNRVILMKLNLEGTIEWEKTYDGNKSDIANDILQTMDGHYLMLSSTSSFGGEDLDVMLTKVDQNGEIVWDKLYGGDSSDQGKKVLERSNGDIVILGNSNEGTNPSSQFELFLLTTDSEGNPQ